jgi:hypothetical protein
MSDHQGGAIGYGEAQELADDVDADLRPNFGGGGMVGKGCLAMVTNDPLNLMFKIGERGRGPSYIVYWPGIEVEDERDQLAGDDRPRFEDVRHSGVGAPGWGW